MSLNKRIRDIEARQRYLPESARDMTDEQLYAVLGLGGEAADEELAAIAGFDHVPTFAELTAVVNGVQR